MLLIQCVLAIIISALSEGETNRRLKAPIKFLGISVGKFEEQNEIKKTRNLKDYFANPNKIVTGSKNNGNENNNSIKDENISEEEKIKESKENSIETTTTEKLSKIKVDKEFIFQKFFNVDSSDNTKVKIEKNSTRNVLETTLNKQESFFAKFLNQTNNTNKEKSSSTKSDNNERSTTPICNVNTCGDDSNDTNYSGSTINAEINQSIALFEEDPVDIARVSSMRQLLTHSDNIEDQKLDIVQPELIKPVVESPKPNSVEQTNDDIICSECSKTISMNMIDEHADYHLALKLRDEERTQARREIKERSVSKDVKKDKKKKIEEVCIRNSFSITSFLTKLDSSVPCKTCKECGKKVAEEKFMEHLDFHEAQKLSREINNRTANISCIKRKRESTSPLRNTKVSCKPINLFFR